MKAVRRTLTISTHWTVGFLLLLLISEAEWDWMYWLFGLSSLLMCALALVFGLMNRPGPKLQGPLRLAHPWMHRALYLLLAYVGGLTLYDQVMDTHSPRELFRWYMVLTAAVMVHMIFHLWRHTALMDGALRLITPRVLHKYL